MPCLCQSSRRPREERDVSQCESVASTVSAQEDEDIEASNEEENPEDSEGNFSGKDTCVCPERDPVIYSESCCASAWHSNSVLQLDLAVGTHWQGRSIFSTEQR